jgi:hypothetical protein
MNGVHSTATQRLLFADSKNRDVRLFPSGNNYVLHLTTPIKDIERVDLVSARVPNTMYNCTNGSNVLAVNSSNVSLNPGFYSVYGLAAALTAASTIVLDYLPDEGHFLFSSAASFTVFIHSQELATMLGLSRGSLLTSALAGPTDPAYAAKYIIRSSTLVNMSLNEYVFLDIDELRTPSHVDAGALTVSGTVSGSNANRNFAPVMMDVGSGCIKNFHENKDYSVSVQYPEPIGSLQRLTVRWVDKAGAPVNFRGWETNAFVLRLHIRDRESEEEQEDLKDMARRLSDLEIKRMLDEQAKPPPPPPPPKKTPFGRWTILIILVLIAMGYWGYKTFLRPNPVPDLYT